jgi:putative ABC transport system ATP-binding protein
MELVLKSVCYVYQNKYRRVEAVKNVSCRFEGGKLYAIMGSSGSGKSTLLSIMAGLRLPTAGEVTVGDMPLNTADRCKLRRETISVIYQDFNLFPLLTVLENVTYPLLIQKRDKPSAEQIAKDKLETVGITESMMKQLPHMLSGGEQQRVAIARTLASGSKIILADEPTGNLDSENGKNIVAILKRLAHEENCCVVVVTHDPSVAAEADVLLKMKDGKIEQE